MIVPIASDHAGYPAKEKAKKILIELGHEPLDLGTDSEESVDYPDMAVPVAERIRDHKEPLGILICGSGQGMCMTANKFDGVRAALVYNTNSARLTRQHNNANILCLPGRELSDDQLREIIQTWLDTDFEGGRHERRVNKIHSLTDSKRA
ncbi:MAG: ribose 5-phosphate isomerase B [Balneolaceae bacterium]